MEEIIIGSLIMWVLDKMAKKKADAPGTTALPRQNRTPQSPTSGSPTDQNSDHNDGGRPEFR